MARERKQVRTGEVGKGFYWINELSHLVNLSSKRLREYEKESFFKPLREKNTNNRFYSPFDIVQIAQVTQADP